MRYRTLRKALGALLLMAVFAVLLQGILHEVLHDSEPECCSLLFDETIVTSEHDDECHAHHKTCSSLSCSQGALFLAGAAFCWQNFGQVEPFAFAVDNFRLPIIAANFFIPPKPFAG